MSGLRTGGDDAACISDLRLDRLLTGELDDAERAAVEAHVSGCAACGARHAEYSREHQRFADAGPDFATLAARVERRRATRTAALPARLRSLTAIGGLALAAVAVLALVPVLRPPAPQSVRSKGKPELGYFVKRGERVVEGVPGSVLHPGDRIRFVTSSDRPRYLALLDQDGRGVTVYYPATSDAARVPAGSEVPLDFSVELDAYPGSERVFALFCDEPFAIAPVRDALQAGGAVPVLAGCSLANLELYKEAAP
jgi:hypothetical protein